MTQIFYLGHTHLGSRESPPTIFPFHIALCCPTCGEVWGRVMNTSAMSWVFQSRPCGDHWTEWPSFNPLVSGSFYDPPHSPRDLAPLPFDPPALVKYEFTNSLRKV